MIHRAHALPFERQRFEVRFSGAILALSKSLLGRELVDEIAGVAVVLAEDFGIFNGDLRVRPYSFFASTVSALD